MSNKAQLFKQILDNIADGNNIKLVNLFSSYFESSDNKNEATILLVRLFGICLNCRKYEALLALTDYNFSLTKLYPQIFNKKSEDTLYCQKLFALFALGKYEEAQAYIMKLSLLGEGNELRLINSCITALENHQHYLAADIARQTRQQYLTKSGSQQPNDDDTTDTALIGEPTFEESKTPDDNV